MLLSNRSALTIACFAALTMLASAQGFDPAAGVSLDIQGGERHADGTFCVLTDRSFSVTVNSNGPGLVELWVSYDNGTGQLDLPTASMIMTQTMTTAGTMTWNATAPAHFAGINLVVQGRVFEASGISASAPAVIAFNAPTQTPSFSGIGPGFHTKAPR